jgi:hypothetical protein
VPLISIVAPDGGGIKLSIPFIIDPGGAVVEPPGETIICDAGS